jgi:hypothetical protein
MNQADLSPLERLRLADPDTYAWVKGDVALMDPPPEKQMVAKLSEATIWGLSIEAGLGAAVARGILSLLGRGSPERISAYDRLVREAAGTGPTLSRILATFLPPVLINGDLFLKRFQKTVAVMQQKGTYTLNTTLEAMAELLSAGDMDSATAYLDLLADTFSQQITYNQSLRLVYLLPKAVSNFDAGRCKAQIEQLHKLAMFDLQLVEPYLDGVVKGTELLDDIALDDFVSQALERYARSPAASRKFLSLVSKVGKDTFAALRRAVPLGHVSPQLDRYLSARLGRSVAVKPLSELPIRKNEVQWVCSDGRHIFLPDKIDRQTNQAGNVRLYKMFTRLEAGFFECRTFDFDLEKAADRYSEVAEGADRRRNNPVSEGLCDGERFVIGFTPTALAQDLFNLFEQARVMVHLRSRYPGLVRRVIPLLAEPGAGEKGLDVDELLAPVYSALVLEKILPAHGDPDIAQVQHRLVELFCSKIDDNSTVETSSYLVCLAFDLVSTVLGERVNQYQLMALPYGRRIDWGLVSRAFAHQDQTPRRIKLCLQRKGLDLYLSDLRNCMAEQHGVLSGGDIAELVLSRSNARGAAPSAIDPSRFDLTELDLAALLGKSGVGADAVAPTSGEAYGYPEWDCHLQDYLYNYTRVIETEIPVDSGGMLYSRLLERHRGLVASVRRAFELLKPEGLALLRQWPEGDAFDYRALLDFAVDRRAGRIPSDRLFIKRLKQERDVAVMLLVDLSRSTANTVSGSHRTVLEVTQEALVLFCEALQVVGDDYAIGGFSGTGRHNVDYYNIKKFREPFGKAVCSRISNLKPQRSTRMGAAIRHAGALLAKAEARIRLMIIVSDGFPNDLGYKSDYAIADTRRSIQEARSRNFHVKAITVNIGSDPGLDELYGRNHHHIIGDVHDLPGKLVRLYGTLTRY